ncbi:MAG: ribosomal protein S18-alanine N-acetyltransferase [Anaerococcus sp.]|nr:ribosomal protein S18-alanine N-acetyltransferase [Anaerococcus sp.]
MIRKMEISDANKVYDIENKSFFEPWSKKKLIKDLTGNSFLHHYVYEEDSIVKGFYIASLVLDMVEIFTIAVDEKFRQEGIGSLLLEDLIFRSKKRGAKEIWLEVSTKNYKAIGLYEKYKFEKMGIRKNYYHKIGEDAYNMKRTLV